eukprot:GSA120T00019943001.1
MRTLPGCNASHEYLRNELRKYHPRHTTDQQVLGYAPGPETHAPGAERPQRALRSEEEEEREEEKALMSTASDRIGGSSDSVTKEPTDVSELTNDFQRLSLHHARNLYRKLHKEIKDDRLTK